MVLTALLLAAVIITLAVYQRRGTTDHSGRLVYNTISTGLSLGLGLNFFEVFKDMAKVVRWRVLGREFTVREVDLVSEFSPIKSAASILCTRVSNCVRHL